MGSEPLGLEKVINIFIDVAGLIGRGFGPEEGGDPSK